MEKRELGTVIAITALLVAPLATTATRAEPAKDTKTYAADKGPATLDVNGYPKEIQENYKIFAVKCAKCHTLARPINTDKTAQEWKMYVKRMMNKPDSGISPSTGKRIYRFLKFRQMKKDQLRGSRD